MRREISWKAAVLTAFILVGVICVIMAAFKSCRADEEKAPEPAPAAEAVSAADEFGAPAKYEPEPVTAELPPRTYVGRCRLTVYNSTESRHGYATATGAKSQHLMTCAVDPKVIPYGSNVIIKCADGTEHRCKAVDCGGFSGKWVDIFFDDSEAHGIQWLDECFGGDFGEVWIEEPYCPTIEMGA